MDIAKLTKKIFTQKTTDYTFAIMFFLIFSMFIVFAIKPALTTATGLKKEEFDLESIDKVYEGHIMNIASVQSTMEAYRDQFPLLEEAISTHPQVNKVIDDIKKSADTNSFSITNENIGEVNLLNIKSKTLQTLTITLEGQASFDNLMKFVDELNSQRRLKTIQKMAISPITDNQSTPATGSGTLRVSMQIEAYYL